MNGHEFTAATINALLPAERTLEFTDSPGLTLRVTPAGTKAWRVWWPEGGRLRRRTVGRWPAMSAPAARAQRDRLRAGAKGGATFAAFAEQYLEQDARPYKRSADLDARALHRDVIPVIGHRPLVALSRAECVDVIDRIRDRGSPDMASRVRSVLRKVLYLAVDRSVITVNPAARIHAPQGNARDRVLTADELAAWFTELQAAPPAPRWTLLLQLLTATRLGEVLGIAPHEIDHREAIWHLPAEKAKTGASRAIPLSPLALAIVRARNATYQPRRLSQDSVRRWMRAAIKASGLPRATPHDLRRTAATHLAELGTDRETIDRILGHADASVTGRYDRYERQPEQRAALEAWAEKLDAITDHRLTTAIPEHARHQRQREISESSQDERERSQRDG